MKAKRNRRTTWLTLRLSEEEAGRIAGQASKTTCQSMSEYARAVLLRNPVLVRYRNGTADDFLEEMVALKKELEALAEDFRTSVQRLQELDREGAFGLWLAAAAGQRAALLKKTDQILHKATQIHLLWSSE